MADLSDQILAHVRKRTYQPLKPKALARKLGVSTPQYDDFKRALRKLLRVKVLEFGKNHTIRGLAPHGSITGTFRRISIGGGFVRPDWTEQVIGVLYGERLEDNPQTSRSDTYVEAVLVDLLACGVSTGLAHLEQEKTALRATTLFEQFFSPELARHLAADPGLLEGREATVTILFADVRPGRTWPTYSRTSRRRLTARRTDERVDGTAGHFFARGGGADSFGVSDASNFWKSSRPRSGSRSASFFMWAASL